MTRVIAVTGAPRRERKGGGEQDAQRVARIGSGASGSPAGVRMDDTPLNTKRVGSVLDRRDGRRATQRAEHRGGGAVSSAA